MCVGFLYYAVEVSILSCSLFNKHSRNGNLLPSSSEFYKGLTEFKWSNKCFSIPYLTMQKV